MTELQDFLGIRIMEDVLRHTRTEPSALALVGSQDEELR